MELCEYLQSALEVAHSGDSDLSLTSWCTSDFAQFNLKLPIWFPFDPPKVCPKAVKISLGTSLWIVVYASGASASPFCNGGGIGIGRMVVALTRTSSF